MLWQGLSSIANGSAIETRLVQGFTDFAVRRPSLFWIARDAGGHVLFGVTAHGGPRRAFAV
jgi:hypothetical protein